MKKTALLILALLSFCIVKAEAATVTLVVNGHAGMQKELPQYWESQYADFKSAQDSLADMLSIRRADINSVTAEIYTGNSKKTMTLGDQEWRAFQKNFAPAGAAEYSLTVNATNTSPKS